MLPRSSVSSTIGQLDRDIAEAERLINEKVQSLLVALRKGADTMEAEARVRDMRRALTSAIRIDTSANRRLVLAIEAMRGGDVPPRLPQGISAGDRSGSPLRPCYRARFEPTVLEARDEEILPCFLAHLPDRKIWVLL